MLKNRIRHWLATAIGQMERQKPTAERFTLHSGERQTGKTLDEIRADHIARYRYAADCIKSHFASNAASFGLDIFCGNGYGTHLLAGEAGCPMLGIDASTQAIELANAHYSGPLTYYVAKVFPFTLPQGAYDFITCLESVEHIPQTEAFLDQVINSLKPGGLLILSTPNAALWSLDLNPNPFHFRHFSREEVVELLTNPATHGLQLVDWQGQNLYRFENASIVEPLPAELMHLSTQNEGQVIVFAFRKPT